MHNYELSLAIIAGSSAGILVILMGIGSQLRCIVTELQKRNAR